jgi:hypothetical protein
VLLDKIDLGRCGSGVGDRRVGRARARVGGRGVQRRSEDRRFGESGHLTPQQLDQDENLRANQQDAAGFWNLIVPDQYVRIRGYHI